MSAASPPPTPGRGPLRRLARTLARVLVVALAPGLGWAAGLIWFAEGVPHPQAEGAGQARERTDAIVVLTGGPQRIKTGLALLAEGMAKKLFISGVYRGVDVAELLRVAQQAPEAVACCVVLDYAADSTAANAAETRAWMEREGFVSLRLVTADFHMRRSLLEFRRALPEARLIAHPVATETFRREQWWRRRAFGLIATEYNKYLAALARTTLQRSIRPGGARPAPAPPPTPEPVAPEPRNAPRDQAPQVPT